MLRCSNVAKLVHSTQDILLPLPRTLRICNGIVERRCLGQAGEQGAFREAQLVERLVEINLRGGAETIGALPEVDLIDVQLENLLLAEAVLDLEGEQRFVELAVERFFRGEKEVARHLH